jgi:putative restriction endonuclease
MQGKTFPGDSDEGGLLWRNLEAGATAANRSTRQGFFEEDQARYGEPVLVTPRLGQGAFRVAITELYRRQCALTGGKVLPALDAAHIRPYAEGGTHTKSNGILLRKDIHSVFDAGYATIDTDYRFVVSEKVKDIFNNGEEYRRLHGAPLCVPDNPAERPDRSLLQWHNDCRYLG